MAAGRRPKTSRIAAVSRSTGTVSVPNVSTYSPTGCEVPIAYAMRWVAKNVVAAGLARRCEIQVAYAIGTSHPVGLYVETFGTVSVPVDRLTAAIREVFDLRPAAIVRDLDLLRPIYSRTAAYGHFGRELADFTWERTDRILDLHSALG